jgi:hypothetical protein
VSKPTHFFCSQTSTHPSASIDLLVSIDLRTVRRLVPKFATYGPRSKGEDLGPGMSFPDGGTAVGESQ